MKQNTDKIGESKTCADEDRCFKRFLRKLRTWRVGRSVRTSRRRPMLPPETDANVSARRVFLGSTVEFMQRDYFSEPQPKKNERDKI